MPVTIYVIPGSHPCRAGLLMLELRPLLASRPAGELMDRVLPEGAGPR